MYPLNLSDNECIILASVLGCQVASLPLTYLGVSINSSKLYVLDWQIIIDKIEK